MSEPLDFPIRAGGPVSQGALELGFTHFAELAMHIRDTAYGRPSESADPLAILREEVGTCSGKHRLLAFVARDSGRPDVELVVGLYDMSDRNTPGVGRVLSSAGLDHLPEAHCYLRTGRRRHDFTGLRGATESPFATLGDEHVVSPDALPKTKERIHREALDAWARDRGLDTADAWRIRERCIAALAAGQARQGA